MVSIQNPAVTVEDIWQYGDRSITDETGFFSRLGNTLLQFMLGDTYSTGQWGWYITEGLLQGVKELLNNRSVVLHSFNTQTYSIPSAIGCEVVDGATCSNGWSASGLYIPVTLQTYSSNMSTDVRDAFYFQLSKNEQNDMFDLGYYLGKYSGSLSDSGVYAHPFKNHGLIDDTHAVASTPDITYDSNPWYLLLMTTPYFTNTSTCFSTSRRVGYINLDKVIHAINYISQGRTFNIDNIVGNQIVNVTVEFLQPTQNPWTIGLFDGESQVSTFDVPIGSTKFNTPSSFEWNNLTSSSDAKIVFNSPSQNLFVDGIKYVTATEIVNTQNTFSLLSEHI